MGAAGGGEPDLVSAVVCTRDRGDRIRSTVESILRNDHPRFELVVVDQSEHDDTHRAMASFTQDSRVRYVRSSERGLGRARNTGMDHARGGVIAFTDDDVTVPPGWLSAVVDAFRDHPRAGIVFCNVVAADHDPTAGFVPAYVREGSVEVSSLTGKCRARGIGAGLAVRREAVESIGGFDPLLGAGARFSSCEDGDVAVRLLLAGWHVYETDDVAVVHDGFRTWEEGRELTRRDWYGIGAAYSKPIRVGQFRALVVVLYEGVVRAALQPISMIARGRRPQGLKRAWYFWSGFVAGLRTSVDRSTLRFDDAS